jgi:hypothetical protein
LPPSISEGKASLTPAHKQQIEMFFQPRQGPAYRGSGELEMGGCSAYRSPVGRGHEYPYVVEAARFAHALRGCAAMIIALTARAARFAVDLLILAKTFDRTRFAAAGAGRRFLERADR